MRPAGYMQARSRRGVAGEGGRATGLEGRGARAGQRGPRQAAGASAMQQGRACRAASDLAGRGAAPVQQQGGRRKGAARRHKQGLDDVALVVRGCVAGCAQLNHKAQSMPEAQLDCPWSASSSLSTSDSFSSALLLPPCPRPRPRLRVEHQHCQVVVSALFAPVASERPKLRPVCEAVACVVRGAGAAAAAEGEREEQGRRQDGQRAHLRGWVWGPQGSGKVRGEAVRVRRARLPRAQPSRPKPLPHTSRAPHAAARLEDAEGEPPRPALAYEAHPRVERGEQGAQVPSRDGQRDERGRLRVGIEGTRTGWGRGCAAGSGPAGGCSWQRWGGGAS